MLGEGITFEGPTAGLQYVSGRFRGVNRFGTGTRTRPSATFGRFRRQCESADEHNLTNSTNAKHHPQGQRGLNVISDSKSVALMVDAQWRGGGNLLAHDSPGRRIEAQASVGATLRPTVLLGFRDLRSRSAYRVFSLAAVWSRPSVSSKQRQLLRIYVNLVSIEK